jgi:hypothetical protein
LASGFTRKLLSLIVIVAGVTAAQSAPPAQSKGFDFGFDQPSQAAQPRKDIPAIAKAANGAIVTVITATGDEPIAQGTGFLVSAEGVTVTNYHVIKEGNVAIVKFPDGTVLPVDGVLATDKVRDLAIIKIHGKTFRTLTLGNSDQIQVGEEVIAIGNPLGLELTVSNGIISGVRTSKEQGGKFLQTTAPISPGSSGGPLFNMHGEVVGINTMYLEGGENLNFAIPVNDAKLLLQKRSAKFQDLPNEVEKETPIEEHAEATPAQEQTCSERAVKFVQYKRAQYATDKPRVEYASNYDAKSRTCFVENGFYFAEGRAYPSGRMYFSRIQIEDAFSEGSGGRSYGSFSFGSGCTIKPPNAQEISCRSKEEFDDLALKYFGIARQLSGSTTGAADTIFAESSPDLEHAPLGQFLKDAAYCHHNPQNFLQFPGKDDVVSCQKVNSDVEMRIRLCKTGPTSVSCENVLSNLAKIEEGFTPTNTDNPLPPNTKIAAVPDDGTGTWEQLWEDAKYCYQNPANSLKASDGEIVSCSGMNAVVEARVKACKSKGPKDNRENCKDFLKSFKDLKAGRL